MDDAPPTDRCPRCGGGFHCGARDAAPCPCGTLSLPPDLLETLRMRYDGCLCLDCLQELATARRQEKTAASLAARSGRAR